LCFFFQAEDGIRDRNVTGVQTCALPIYLQDGATELHAGSSQVAEGNQTVKQGWGDLQDGATELHDGSSQVADGNQTVKKGWGDLQDGANQLHDGSSQVADGNQTV